MPKTVRELIDEAHALQRRQAFKDRQWKCVRCGKRFRLSKSDLEAILETGSPQARQHCGLPLLLVSRDS